MTREDKGVPLNPLLSMTIFALIPLIFTIMRIFATANSLVALISHFAGGRGRFIRVLF